MTEKWRDSSPIFLTKTKRSNRYRYMHNIDTRDIYTRDIDTRDIDNIDMHNIDTRDIDI